VHRVIRVQELFAAGLPSSKIALMLPYLRDGRPCEIPIPELVADLKKEREWINRMITDLRNTRAVLDDVIEAASN
jgi:hypothetical protein